MRTAPGRIEPAELVVDRVSKRFGDTAALDEVSVRAPAGTTTTLVGPSGCGKSTLLRIVAGLTRPDQGTVSVAGEPLSAPNRFVRPEKRRLGLVFQDSALFPHLTVARNVAFGLSRGDVAAGRVDEALELVRLPHLGARYPDELSGGQAQRVALARAIAPRPRVLLFDEAFSNLDASLRVELRTEVVALVRDLGITAVFVTHDQEEAFVLGAQVAVMRDGRIVQVGTPGEIYDRPADPWVAGFVGEANLVPASGRGRVAETPVGRVPLQRETTGACHVLLRPEYLDISRADDGAALVVRAVQYYGHDTSYDLESPLGRLSVRHIAAPRFAPGDRVSLSYTGPAAATYPAA